MRTAAIAIIGLLIVAALAWNAAELHYENCVESAKATASGTPSSAAQVLGNEPTERARRIEGCSRVPW